MSVFIALFFINPDFSVILAFIIIHVPPGLGQDYYISFTSESQYENSGGIGGNVAYEESQRCVEFWLT